MTDRPKRQSMSLEEATISNMWEIAAIVELLERKGLCTKQDLFDIIHELRKQTPQAKIPETAFPSPYLMTQTEEKVIDDIITVLNTTRHGLEAGSRFVGAGRDALLRWGLRMTRGTTH